MPLGGASGGTICPRTTGAMGQSRRPRAAPDRQHALAMSKLDFPADRPGRFGGASACRHRALPSSSPTPRPAPRGEEESRKRVDGRRLGEGSGRRSSHRHDGDGNMQTTPALPGSARTWLNARIRLRPRGRQSLRGRALQEHAERRHSRDSARAVASEGPAQGEASGGLAQGGGGAAPRNARRSSSAPGSAPGADGRSGASAPTSLFHDRRQRG